MRFWTWLAFFVVCNVLGVEVFKAAVTLPLEEALLPGVLTVPLIGLTALGATRLVSLWNIPKGSFYKLLHGICRARLLR
jgi:hypothetical protein